jgi:hypothetical protein
MDEHQAKVIQQQLAAMLTDRMKFKIVRVVFALFALYAVPITLFALVAHISTFVTGAPIDVIALVKFIPFSVLSIGSVVGAVVFARKERDCKEQEVYDAQRRQAVLERTGSANEKARRMAGVANAEAPPSRVSSAFAGVAAAQGAFASRMADAAPTPVAAPSTLVSRPPAASGMTVERAAARVRCMWCGRHVSVAQGDEETGMATCSSCGNTFSMREVMQIHMGMRSKPIGLDASVVADTCTIVHETGTVFSYLVPIIAFVILVLSLPEALERKSFDAIGVIGAFIVVSTVVTKVFKSRTTVYTITPHTFIVAIHGFLGREIGQWDRGDVDQIFVRQKKHTRREQDTRSGASSSRRRKVTYYTYDVILLDAAGRETRLSANLERLEHALYIEQEIENRFAIVDRKMGHGPSR